MESVNKSLFISNRIIVNDYIYVKVPTIGEILNYGEREYFSLVSSFMATPYEMMAPLHLAGIDYEEITEFELFTNMFLASSRRGCDLSIIFGGLDAAAYRPAKSRVNGGLILWDEVKDRVIDRNIQLLIGDALRTVTFTEKVVKKAGNKEAKDYLIQRAAEKYERRKKKKYISFLEDLIIALVNTEQFKYNYETTMDLSLYKFNASVKQIPRKINYDHMIGAVYGGTLKYGDIEPKELNWLTLH